MTTNDNNPSQPDVPEAAYDEFARHALEDDPHYVTMVADLADQNEVIASEDIYAANGTKLVTKGTTLDSGLRDLLIKHKLFKPIDRSVAVSGVVSKEFLATETGRLIDNQGALRQLAARSGDMSAMRYGLSQISLPDQLAFKLTVVKERRPQMFRHLLLVALIAHYLALRLKMPAQDIRMLLAAALFHDLGELHTDPALLDPEHRISDEERRYVYVHPITGHLIAREAGSEPVVANAILQHHERLDGSGYPYGLRGDQVGELARILGVADVCASIFDRYGNSERLSTLVRLNRQKYDATLLSLLQEGFGGQNAPVSAAQSADNTIHQLRAFGTLFEKWDEFRASLPSAASGQPLRALEFLLERMVTLRLMLLQFGFDPDSLELLVDLASEDPAIAQELISVVDEMRWQFSDLAQEINRRQQSMADSLAADKRAIFEQWVALLQHTLHTDAPAEPVADSAEQAP